MLGPKMKKIIRGIGSMLFLFSTLSSVNSNHVGFSLKFVQVVFRHGSRSPVTIYPNNPNKEAEFWPMGLLQLTPKGVEQAVELGSNLRREYVDKRKLLSETFKTGEVWMRSSDTDRTLMSAQALASGLYPRSYTNYSIPVHTVPQEQDRVLVFPQQYGCNKYYDIVQEQYDSGKYIDELQEQIKSGLLDSIASHCGYTGNQPGLINMWKIEDNIRVDKENGLPQENWIDQDVEDALKKVAISNLVVFNMNDDMIRMGGGHLLQSLRENFDKKIKDPSSRLKLAIYSAHDISLTYILSILKNWEPHLPAYCASITFELWQSDIDYSYYLRVWHRDSNLFGSSAKLLQIPFCVKKCPFSSFVNLTNVYLPGKDFNALCGIDEDETNLRQEIESLEESVANKTSLAAHLRRERDGVLVALLTLIFVCLATVIATVTRCVVVRLRQPWDPSDATKNIYRLFNNHNNQNTAGDPSNLTRVRTQVLVD